MSEYATIEHYVNHVMDEITKRDVEQVSESLRAFGWEEVVRCRDCKFSHEVEWPEWMNVPSDYLDCHGELVETWDYYNDEPNNNPVKPDGFCAWGERRDA